AGQQQGGSRAQQAQTPGGGGGLHRGISHRGVSKHLLNSFVFDQAQVVQVLAVLALEHADRTGNVLDHPDHGVFVVLAAGGFHGVVGHAGDGDAFTFVGDDIVVVADAAVIDEPVIQ